jgi:hypothetical protein
MTSLLDRTACFVLACALSLSPSSAVAQSTDSCIAAFEEGQVLRDQLHLRAARERFLQCARDACAIPVRKDCAENLDLVTRDLPTLAVGARDEEGRDLPDVRVSLDGEPVLVDPSGRSTPCDPGPHAVRFELAGFPAVTVHILLRMGERNRPVVVTLHPATSPVVADRTDGRRATWGYALAGVGLAGLGTFTLFAIDGKAEKNHLLGTCAPACTEAQVSDLKTMYITADVSLAIGLVAAGIATYLFATAAHGAHVPPAVLR